MACPGGRRGGRVASLQSAPDPGASCASKPHPRPLSTGGRGGNVAERSCRSERRRRSLSPPSPLRGEGPRVRLQRQDAHRPPPVLRSLSSPAHPRSAGRCPAGCARRGCPAPRGRRGGAGRGGPPSVVAGEADPPGQMRGMAEQAVDLGGAGGGLRRRRRGGLVAAGHEQLVGEDQHRLGEVERRLHRRAGDGHHGARQGQLLVGEPSDLGAEDEGGGGVRRSLAPASRGARAARGGRCPDGGRGSRWCRSPAGRERAPRRGRGRARWRRGRAGRRRRRRWPILPISAAGSTRMSRSSPMLAIARAAEPTFPSSRGRTRTTAGSQPPSYRNPRRISRLKVLKASSPWRTTTTRSSLVPPCR